MNQLQNESMVNYGNKSKIGILLNSQNKKLLDYQKLLKAEEVAKKKHIRRASELNKSQIEELAHFR